MLQSISSITSPYMPAALPFIFNALKINATLALIGAIVAEFFGTPTQGIGFRISTEAGRMAIDMVWAEIALAALAGMGFYGLVALGTIGGTALSLLHVNPIRLLVIVALINGIAAAPFLVIILLIANDSKLMGKRRNGRAANVLCWITAGLMSAAALTLLVTGGGV